MGENNISPWIDHSGPFRFASNCVCVWKIYIYKYHLTRTRACLRWSARTWRPPLVTPVPLHTIVRNKLRFDWLWNPPVLKVTIFLVSLTLVIMTESRGRRVPGYIGDQWYYRKKRWHARKLYLDKNLKSKLV